MDDEKILRHLRVMHVHGKIELSLNPPPEKPSCPDDRVPHSLAKYQAGLGQDPTTASHWPVWMDSVDKLIVVLLGESHTVDKVVKELLRRGTSGDIAISENVDTGNPAWALRAKVKACLHTLGRWGLLDKMVD